MQSPLTRKILALETLNKAILFTRSIALYTFPKHVPPPPDCLRCLLPDFHTCLAVRYWPIRRHVVTTMYIDINCCVSNKIQRGQSLYYIRIGMSQVMQQVMFRTFIYPHSAVLGIFYTKQYSCTPSIKALRQRSFAKNVEIRTS